MKKYKIQVIKDSKALNDIFIKADNPIYAFIKYCNRMHYQTRVAFNKVEYVSPYSSRLLGNQGYLFNLDEVNIETTILNNNSDITKIALCNILYENGIRLNISIYVIF